jgi:hypothetical protein
MADDSSRSFGKEVNAWVQTLGIVLAAAWGVYTFTYMQIIVPKSAPVNITMDLGLKKFGLGKSNQKDPTKRLIPVEMKVSAKNPSTREIYLQPSVWMATGVKVARRDVALGEEQPITTNNEEVFDQRYASESDATVLGFGGLLEDTSLKPNEVSARTFIFYVPPDMYDYVEVVAVMPTSDKKGIVEIEWNLNNEENFMEPKYYKLDAKGKRQGEIKQEEVRGYSVAHGLDLQSAVARSEVSLWE